MKNVRFEVFRSDCITLYKSVPEYEYHTDEHPDVEVAHVAHLGDVLPKHQKVGYLADFSFLLVDFCVNCALNKRSFYDT